jgi:hypothetical protein
LKSWDQESDRRLLLFVKTGCTWLEIAERMSTTRESVRSRYRLITGSLLTGVMPLIANSPYPVYDQPLVTEGDALVICDPEFPFHHADFLNRVFELAVVWGITNCIIGGDVLHFNSISSFEAAWMRPVKSGISEDAEKELMDLGSKLSAEQYQELTDIITRNAPENNDGNIGEEVKVARKELIKIGQIFKDVVYVLGNHDGRFLSALNSPLFATDLLNFIGINDPAWRISCFYFSKLNSGNREFRIEHPKSAAHNTAVRLSDKYETSVLMGHSHFVDFRFGTSGKNYAIQMGCSVDERRLPYASQRSTNVDAHVLGAVIVKDGFPYLLTQQTQWERMKRMV